MISRRLLPFFLCAMLAPPAALAEDAPPIAEAPPAAAPTVDVAVSSLPVVRSISQQVDDFASGLLQGLIASEDIPGLALIVVEGDRVMVQKSLGVQDPRSLVPVNGDSVFAVGGLSGVMIGIAALQQIEQERLRVIDDAGALLGEGEGGITVGQLLSHRVAGASDILARVVERASGLSIGGYIESRILVPLGMAHSHFEGDVFTTTASDMGRFLIALLRGGGAAGSPILRPDTLALISGSQVTAHPSLAGWPHVFAEMRRGGWRALQHDGASGGVAARLVFEPEARLGYFLVANRNPGPAFWRGVDGALFDRILPPRGVGAVSATDIPQPSYAMAEDAAGTWLAQRGPESEVLFLKTVRAPLEVEAREDGALVFSGAENAILLPRPGGYWRSNEAQINAALVNGRLYIDQSVYDWFRAWERPRLYAWLALFLGLVGTAFMVQAQRLGPLLRLGTPIMVYAGPLLMGASFLLLVAAIILQRLAFAP
jgi:CubicO group peptidase (beta-lactamase class C family)